MTAIPTYAWEVTTEQLARRAGLDPRQVVRFDTNTSPLSPPWVAEAAARAARESVNEYPPADYRRLTQAIAHYAGVDPGWVVIGAGADELIDLVAKAFLPPGGRALTATPTYSLYGVITGQRPAELVEVPRPAFEFSLPLEVMLEAASESDLVWICEPNNPTGRRDPDQQVAALIEGCRGVVILDAAYAEFGGDRWGPWVERYSNLVVLHTLSKAFALAGIRVGYALAQPELADQVNRRRLPGSVSVISAGIAVRALGDPTWVKETIEVITAERSRLADALRGLGLQPLTSEANFLLIRVGERSKALAEDLLRGGLVVRTFDHESPLAPYLRLTVRSAEEDDRLLDALQRSLR